MFCFRRTFPKKFYNAFLSTKRCPWAEVQKQKIAKKFFFHLQPKIGVKTLAGEGGVCGTETH